MEVRYREWEKYNRKCYEYGKAKSYAKFMVVKKQTQKKNKQRARGIICGTECGTSDNMAKTEMIRASNQDAAKQNTKKDTGWKSRWEKEAKS